MKKTSGRVGETIVGGYGDWVRAVQLQRWCMSWTYARPMQVVR